MCSHYLENPILLVNSSGPLAASGRNVRAQFRTKQAAKRIRSESQSGQFGVFELGPGNPFTPVVEGYPARKKKKRSSPANSKDAGTIAQWPRVERQRRSPTPEIQRCERPPPSLPRLNPSEVLAYATFHIRLMSSMALLSDCDRLSQVLMCRQWSCISLPSERLGKSDVLDSALACVTARVCQLNGTISSTVDDLLMYEEALSKLQNALETPKRHEVIDLRTSIQLLATYEMLRSFDNPGWSHHVSGVKLLCQPQTMIMGEDLSVKGLSHALTLPIAAEALLTGDDSFFDGQPWRTLLKSVCDSYELLSRSSMGLTTCMVDLPMLISDTKTAFDGTRALDTPVRDALLDRAKLLRSRVRFDILNEDAYVSDRGSKFGAFDELGMCLAGLVALDRVISSLRDNEIYTQKMIRRRTEEFCAQMIHLDLGAGGAYAAADLMFAFQMSPFRQEAAFIVVLPGRSGEDR